MNSAGGVGAEGPIVEIPRNQSDKDSYCHEAPPQVPPTQFEPRRKAQRQAGEALRASLGCFGERLNSSAQRATDKE